MRGRRILFLGVFSSLLIIVLLQVWFAIVSLPFWNLQEIVILNNDYVPRERILAELDLNKQISLLRINKKIVRKKLLGIPQIEKVKVKRQLPGTMLIDLQVKEPYLLMLIRDHHWIVDSQGNILNKEGITPRISSTLCVVKGVSSIGLIEETILEISKLIDAIYLFLDKEQVTVDCQNMADLKLFLNNSLVVRLGEPTHFTEKTRNLSYVLQALGGRRHQAKYIDLRAYQTPAVKF